MQFKGFGLDKKIGVLAVSAPTEAGRLARGVEILRSFGFREKVALDPCAAFGRNDFMFSSDSPKARARALEALYADPEVGVIIAVRGAYGCMEMLPELNFELLARSPKPIVGFSDVTALLLALQHKAGLPAVHGPSIESFARAGEEPDARTSAQALIDLLTGKHPNPFSGSKLELFLGDSAPVDGILSGGNLTLIAAILGTPWAPKFKNCILCLEETNDSPYRIHRHLLQLRLAGCLDGVKGILLGAFTNCVHKNGLGPDIEMVFKDIFGPLGVPVYRGAPFGHQLLNLPLPFGAKARMAAGGLVFENS